jgi:hypothetical protein
MRFVSEESVAANSKRLVATSDSLAAKGLVGCRRWWGWSGRCRAAGRRCRWWGRGQTIGQGGLATGGDESFPPRPVCFVGRITHGVHRSACE